eukprot:TRINITY_DN15135_c0_g1_i1.p1 TRINITY_DN15135_c0_g1~~TRINITY_DN15135_c0_g1_i1.p1  ORF type:complete len:161 (+),score=9.56 TRINITY_DN15135_c0_g1_i1:308-790(+)
MYHKFEDSEVFKQLLQTQMSLVSKKSLNFLYMGGVQNQIEQIFRRGEPLEAGVELLMVANINANIPSICSFMKGFESFCEERSVAQLSWGQRLIDGSLTQELIATAKFPDRESLGHFLSSSVIKALETSEEQLDISCLKYFVGDSSPQSNSKKQNVADMM